MLRPLGLERLMWKPILADFPSGGHWYDQREYMRAHIGRFKAAPYRPNYRNGFGDEQKFIEITNAAQNVLYQSGDLTGYVEANDRVKAFFDVVSRSEPWVLETIVWADHAHHRATLAQKRGNLNEAAQLNFEVSEVHNKYNRELDALCYRGCTACSRLEQFTKIEDSLACQISKDLRDIGVRLNTARAGTNSPDREVVKAYNALLVCKAELHRKKPDVHVIRDSVARARVSISFLSPEAQNELKPIVDFYDAAGLYFSGGPVNVIAYQGILDRIKQDAVHYHCLLRIPESVDEQLAAAHFSQNLHVNWGLVELREAASAKLARWASAGAIIFAAVALANIVLGNLLQYNLYVGFSLLSIPLFVFTLIMTRLSRGDCVDANHHWHSWLPHIQGIALSLLLVGLSYLISHCCSNPT